VTAYRDLGTYSDWVGHTRARAALGWGEGTVPDPTAVRERVRAALGLTGPLPTPADVRVEERWEDGDVAGEVVSWQVGYGPRTEAWVLRPRDASGPLPGVVALHDHGGFKWYGKEKVGVGPAGVAPGAGEVHEHAYGGRGFANVLAARGFVVVAHDVFTWGSRRFDLGVEHIGGYNDAAARHEHVVEKYCRLLGTSMAAVVAHEDRVALSYLRGRPDVEADSIGCVGMSGGGLRAGLLQATTDELAAAVVVAMMSTYEGLLDHNVAGHTWMLFPAGVPQVADWPQLVGCRPASPLLVQYNRSDHLFAPSGMAAADEQLRAMAAAAGHPNRYAAEWYEGGHKFDRPMQDAAFTWLGDVLRT
jgi:dienelactone hydrolase